MNWISVKKQPVPFGKPIVATNGKEMALCKIEVNNYYSSTTGEIIKVGEPTIQVLGAWGYEWESEFSFNEITHWIDMGELELPK